MATAKKSPAAAPATGAPASTPAAPAAKKPTASKPTAPKKAAPAKKPAATRKAPAAEKTLKPAPKPLPKAAPAAGSMLSSPKVALPKAAAPKVALPKADKPKKPKLVRDSFTIPKAEYTVLDELKARAAKLGHPAKKSEVLRAGLKALAVMSDSAFSACLGSVPAIKTGRPAKD